MSICVTGKVKQIDDDNALTLKTAWELRTMTATTIQHNDDDDDKGNEDIPNNSLFLSFGLNFPWFLTGIRVVLARQKGKWEFGQHI